MPAPFKRKPASNKRGDAPSFNGNSKQPFKRKLKSQCNVTISPAAVCLQLEDDAPDFPRGDSGQSERKNASLNDETLLWNSKSTRNRKNGKKTKKNIKISTAEDGDEAGSLFGETISGKVPRFATRITLKNVSPGLKLWGVVTEVNEKDLMVSLPGGLRGLVLLEDAFDPVFHDEGHDILLQRFSVGQLVLCVVSHLDDDKKDNSKKKIRLSLRLSLLYKGFSLDSIQEGMVLSAYIKSVEDHGYILHFGSSSFAGFLPRNPTSDNKVAKPGFIVQGVVKRVDKTRKVVYLCDDQESACKSVLNDVNGMSIDLLVPGMMVNARIHSVLENGIMLSFLTYFTGTVDIFHLQNTLPTSNWKDAYLLNKKVLFMI